MCGDSAALGPFYRWKRGAAIALLALSCQQALDDEGLPAP